jgi:hypothetical protein
VNIFDIYSLFLQLLTYQVDTTTRSPLSQEVERLFIESHIVTFTAEIVTHQLIAKEERLKRVAERINEDNSENFSDDPVLPPTTDAHLARKRKLFPPPYTSTPKSTEAVKRIKLPPIPGKELVRVRLQSGEVVQLPKSLLTILRRTYASRKVVVSSMPPKSVVSIIRTATAISVPFTDRLSAALQRLSKGTPPKTPETKAVPRVNGVVANGPSNGKNTQTVKVCAASDSQYLHSSSSSGRLKSPTSLAGQLQILAPVGPAETAPVNGALRPRQPSGLRSPSRTNSLVPVMIKLRPIISVTKMMKLSTALHRISGDTMMLTPGPVKTPLTNGTTNNGVSSSSFSSSFQQQQQH